MSLSLSTTEDVLMIAVKLKLIHYCSPTIIHLERLQGFELCYMKISFLIALSDVMLVSCKSRFIFLAFSPLPFNFCAIWIQIYLFVFKREHVDLNGFQTVPFALVKHLKRECLRCWHEEFLSFLRLPFYRAINLINLTRRLTRDQISFNMMWRYV